MAEDRAADAWRAHAREQLAAWLRLTPRQRLDWLWQAKRFAARAREANREREAGEPGPEPASR